jgi:PIN domain nuclease of toxin-antitoxin system
MIALDASAFLAFLFREPGHERVETELARSCMSTVNLSEVIARFTRDGHNAVDVLERIKRSPVELVPFLAEDAALTASLVPVTRDLGLSLGDRACLALGMVRRIAVYTADRSWQSAELDVDVQLIRD